MAHLNNEQQLIRFIKMKSYYPHCKNVKSLGDLKTGVVFAELLCDSVDEEYHHIFLPKVETTALTVEKCINNLRIVLETLQIILSMRCENQMLHYVNTWKPEHLYYKQSEIRKLLVTVIIPLDKKSSEKENNPKKQIPTYPSTIAAHQSLSNTRAFKEFQLKNSTKPTQKNSAEISTAHNQQNISQLSAIGNNQESLIMGLGYDDRNYHISEQYNQPIINRNSNYSKQKSNAGYGNYDKEELQIEQEEHHPLEPSEIFLAPQRLNKLEEWIDKKLKGMEDQFQFSEEIREEPDQMLGLLINNIFCGSRFSDPIIKEAQFLQGPIFVYRKILNFILENQIADRVNKENALKMLQTIDQEGIVSQNEYWQLVNDLYEFEQKKNTNLSGSRNNSQSKKQLNKPLSKSRDKQSRKNTDYSDKQNIQNIINRKLPITQRSDKGGKTLINKVSSKKFILQTKPSEKQLKETQLKYQKLFEYSDKILRETERWIGEDLGYEHSLKKSQQVSNSCSNPLLNGSLVASIIMRLKVGRITVIKSPINQKQVRDNWDQIVKVSSLRGYECFKKLAFATKLTYKLYLGILSDFKSQYLKFNPQQQKSQSSKNCNNCPPYILHPPTQHPTHKETYIWINSLNIPFESSVTLTETHLSISAVTAICKKFLNLTIFRETTKKIQENNLQKILGELRRLGISSYYNLNVRKILAEEGMEYRWMIVEDLKWMLEDRVQYSQ